MRRRRIGGGLDAATDALLAITPDVLGEAFAKHVPELPGFRGTMTREDLGRLSDGQRFAQFSEALERTGFCAHPINLWGESISVDAVTGEVLSTYSSADEPDGLTRVPCNSRFGWNCPWCGRRPGCAGAVVIQHQLQRIEGELLLRGLKTPASETTLPLPDICVRALKAQRAQQDQCHSRAVGGGRKQPLTCGGA